MLTETDQGHENYSDRVYKAAQSLSTQPGTDTATGPRRSMAAVETVAAESPMVADKVTGLETTAGTMNGLCPLFLVRLMRYD